VLHSRWHNGRSERLRNRTPSYAINARAIMSNCVIKCTARSRALLGRRMIPLSEVFPAEQ